MRNTPFKADDFFGYISNGIVSVLLIDILFLDRFLTSGNTNDLTSSLLLLGIAYILGHTASSMASATFENILVRNILGVPTGYLLRWWPDDGWRARLTILPWRYTKPMTDDEISRVIGHVGAEHFMTLPPRHLFGRLYGEFLQSDANQDRLDSFRNQYLFARNLAFVLIFWGIVMAVLPFFGITVIKLHLEPLKTADPVVVAVLCFALCVVTVPRYLKFLRLFHMEILTWAANQPPKENPAAAAKPTLKKAAKGKSTVR